ncbi:MAG TPA: hypothetical protein VFU73_00730 [Actinocrinis sp.]|nr:hypothetical protein [Actinocrinis sp.]
MELGLPGPAGRDALAQFTRFGEFGEEPGAAYPPLALGVGRFG